MNALKSAWHCCSAAIVFALAIGVAASGIQADEPKSATPAPAVRTATVERGNIDLAIHAVGTLEPEEVVDVGAQIAGTIVKFGEDRRMPNNEIYWNSKVDVGTVLAYLDDRPYKIARDIAEISVKKSKFALDGAQAALGKATAEYGRYKDLVAKQAISQGELDNARFAVEAAKANAEIAEAQVELDEVALKQAELNLEYTRIRSTVKGTVIDRRVNVGQGVAATLSGPSLFLIAKDLSKLQIWMSVNEADIGQVHQGQNVRFTVDAISDKVFEGKIEQIRNNATMNQNVVTYTVTVGVDNAKEELRPYETANATIKAGGRKNVLLVPNAALCYAAGHQNRSARSRRAEANPFARPPAPEKNRGVVYVQDGDSTRTVDLKLGATDMVDTEVVEGEIKEGMQIIVGEPSRVEGIKAK